MAASRQSGLRSTPGVPRIISRLNHGSGKAPLPDLLSDLGTDKSPLTKGNQSPTVNDNSKTASPNTPTVQERRISSASIASKSGHRATPNQSKKDSGVIFINCQSKSGSQSNDSEKESSDNTPPLTADDILSKCEETDVNKVYEVNLKGEKLKAIPNLKAFKRVRVLDVSSNSIESIRGLETKDLRELKIYDNQITHLQGIEEFKELNILQAQHNKITNIGNGLQVLKKLKVLRLDANRLSKIELRDVTACLSLTSIDISFNSIQSIAFINALPNIEEVFASNNQIKEIPDLGRCKKLTELKLGCNRIVDASGLKGHSALQTLDLDNNKIESVQSIGPIPHLESLSLKGNRLQDISKLHTFYPNLDVLDLSDNGLSNAEDILSELVQLADLREINLSGNRFPSEDPDVKPISPAQMLRLIPELEIFDGMSIRKTIPQAQCSTPLMRPMTASSVVSTRAIESQITNMSNIIEPFEAKGTSCYEDIRAALNSLPAEAPKPFVLFDSESTPRAADSEDDLTNRPGTSGQLTSRAKSRARLKDALDFANKHFG